MLRHFGCEWEYCSYHQYAESSQKILLSRLGFKTNDSQNLISGLEGENNYPLLLKSKYSNGKLYLLNLPDNFGELYALPKLVLDTLRRHLLEDFPFYVQGNGKYMFFPSAEDHFVLYSQSNHVEDYTLISKEPFKGILDLESQQTIEADTNSKITQCAIHLFASTFKIFKILR